VRAAFADSVVLMVVAAVSLAAVGVTVFLRVVEVV